MTIMFFDSLKLTRFRFNESPCQTVLKAYFLIMNSKSFKAWKVIYSASIEALHGHVTNTKVSKFLLKLLENVWTSKIIKEKTIFDFYHSLISKLRRIISYANIRNWFFAYTSQFIQIFNMRNSKLRKLCILLCSLKFWSFQEVLTRI